MDGQHGVESHAHASAPTAEDSLADLPEQMNVDEQVRLLWHAVIHEQIWSVTLAVIETANLKPA